MPDGRKPGVIYTPDTAAAALCRTALRLFLGGKPAEAVYSMRVFDPAAGTGQLLLAMLDEICAAVPGVDRRRIAAHCLHGMELDPEAAAICRQRLGGGQIHCGDTLFADIRERFDLVIGNPPYVDSETMTRHSGAAYRRRIAGRYPCARGNWDLYIPFFERGFELLEPDGHLVYITPDKWLSKSFGEAFRTRCLPYLVSVETAGRDVFPDALVDSVVTVLSSAGSPVMTVGEQTVDKSTLRGPYALDYLFSPRLDLIRRLEAMPGRLKDFGRCESACATSDAYKLLPLLREDSPRADNLRLVNTGTIAPFASRWGGRPITYLKHSFQRPACPRREFMEAFPFSYSRKTALPKIIIKGLNLLHAMPDFGAGYIPGKTTLIFHSPDPENLLFALGIINSDPVRQYVNERYRGSSYNKGVVFTPEMIENIPVPEDKTFYETVVNAVRQILAEPDAPALQDELRRRIRDFYGDDTDSR
jgi:hypothetical protein